MDVLRTPDDRYAGVVGRQHLSAHTDLSTHSAGGSWDLLVPAPLVIDRSGIVRARYVSADYLTRMDPDDIEAALATLDWPERQCLRPAI